MKRRSNGAHQSSNDDYDTSLKLMKSNSTSDATKSLTVDDPQKACSEEETDTAQQHQQRQQQQTQHEQQQRQQRSKQSDLDCSITAIKNHKLFPLLELMLKKCELATKDLSMASFGMEEVLELIDELRAHDEIKLEDDELDNLIVNAVIMLRVHLLELAKLAELCDLFKAKYMHSLRKKMSQESMIGCNGESDDDIDCSHAKSPKPPGQFSIPFWNQTRLNNLTVDNNCDNDSNSTVQPSTSSNYTSVLKMIEKNERFDDERYDSKRKALLPSKAVDRLKAWLYMHASHPYPTESEKAALSHETGLQMLQINNWFINARRRILLPRVVSPNSWKDADVESSGSSNSSGALDLSPHDLSIYLKKRRRKRGQLL